MMTQALTAIRYCSTARALEVVGEKWSLLIVRDLLPAEARFSDLLRSLGAITPKLLTQRLRELEAHGVVERDEAAGRRDVWYRLTGAGQALRPTIEALLVWGIDHAPPPSPTATAQSNRSAVAVVTMLNKRQLFPGQPLSWRVRTPDMDGLVIHFDGERWRMHPDPEVEADLEIAGTVESWVGLLKTGAHARDELLPRFDLEGDPERIEEFNRLLGHPHA